MATRTADFSSMASAMWPAVSTVASRPVLPLSVCWATRVAMASRSAVGSFRTNSPSCARNRPTKALGGSLCISAVNVSLAGSARVRSFEDKSSTSRITRSSSGHCTWTTRDEAPSMVAVKSSGESSRPGLASSQTGIRTWVLRSRGGAAMVASARHSNTETARTKSLTSKTKPQAHLNHAPATRPDDVSGIHVGGAGRTDDRVGLVPVRVVEKIEAGRVELDGTLGTQRYALAQAQIVVLRAGIAQCGIGARSVAHREIRGLLKSDGIEPVRGARVAHFGTHAGNGIHVQRGNNAAGVIELRMERDGRPRIDGGGAADGPAVQNIVPPVGISQERLVGAERQLVAITQLQPLRLVVSGERPLILPVEKVLCAVGPGIVVQLLGDFVVSAQGQSFGRSFFHADKSGVALV